MILPKVATQYILGISRNIQNLGKEAYKLRKWQKIKLRNPRETYQSDGKKD